jgi:hypothetical protein
VARPAAYVAALRALLRAQPHLAPALAFLDATQPRFVAGVVDLGYDAIKCDMGCQTPTHFVERYVDHSYQWNSWALRRHALKLASLQTKATRGAQTAASGFRRDAESQYWVAKVAASQTPVSKGQAMPRQLRYVKGLRGDPVTTKMSVVSMELDLGQPHQY